MKTYIDLDIIKKTVYVSDVGILIRDILEYIQYSQKTNFIIPLKDYVDMLRPLTSATGSVIISGRSENDMPFFSIGGIIFQSITEEEADKYRMLK